MGAIPNILGRLRCRFGFQIAFCETDNFLEEELDPGKIAFWAYYQALLSLWQTIR